MKSLTAKQRLFVNEYKRWRNGSKAARNAGYNPDTAGQKAWTLLNDPKYRHVQEAVRLALDDVDEQLRIQHQMIEDLCIQTIGFDIGDLKTATGEWKDFEQMDPEDRRQISSIQENEYESDGQKGRSLSLKFQNKMEAAKILGKHNGFFASREPAGETAPYRAAEEGLLSLLDRIGQRSAEPVPGATDDGAKKSP